MLDQSSAVPAIGVGDFFENSFFIESVMKVIQFKINFKTKSKIFIQKILIQLSMENSIELFIQKNLMKIIQN